MLIGVLTSNNQSFDLNITARGIGADKPSAATCPQYLGLHQEVTPSAPVLLS